jgi:hypothetical protein
MVRDLFQRTRGIDDDGPEAPVALLEAVMPADDHREFLGCLAVVAGPGGEPPFDRGDVGDQGHHPVEQGPQVRLAQPARAQEDRTAPAAPPPGSAR